MMKPIIRAEWNVCRSCIRWYKVILGVKLSYFSLLEVNLESLKLIYEDFRSLPNDADLKNEYKIFNLGVVFI